MKARQRRNRRKYVTYGLCCVTTALALLAHANFASAYSVSTHVVLTRSAVFRSRIGNVLTKLGYGSVLAEQFAAREEDTFGRGPIIATAEDMIAFGVADEDDLEEEIRVFNHFFDPQNSGRPLTLALPLGSLVFGHPSPDWAIEDRGERTSIRAIPAVNPGLPELVDIFNPGGVAQRFSYRDAQNALWTSVTAPLESERRLAMGKTLLALGHVVHHLQDMAQPQHVRNELHLTGTAAAYYEAYTAKEDKERQIKDLLNRTGTPAVAFDNVRQFWTDGNATGYRGMADFTARNYVTVNTGYRSVASAFGEQIMPHPAFRLPDGVNPLGGAKVVLPMPLTVRLENGTTRTETFDYVIGDVFDRGSEATDPPGTNYARQRLAASSLLNPALTRGQMPIRVYRADQNVFEDGYPILLPRATGFSAGLINHFFRGILDVNFSRTPNSMTRYRITSARALNGRFTVLSEDINGVRAEIPGAQFQLSLAAGRIHDFVLPTPSPLTRRLVLAFRGQVGNEAPPDTGFQAVAAAVIPFTPPPVVPCPGNFRAFGGPEGLDAGVPLGNRPGQVTLKFEAYSIPDFLRVTGNIQGGRVFFDSNGFISGPVTRTFQYNPELDGNGVAIRVVGNSDSGTTWNVAVSCPDASLGPSDFPPLRDLFFTFGSLIPGARGGCSAQVFIDGQFKLLANVSSSAGPTRTNILLTQGAGHGIEYRNFSCLPDTQNVFLGVNFVDFTGQTTVLPPFNATGVRLFDVR